MAANELGKKKFLAVVATGLFAVAASLWVERASLMAWMHVRGLARAGEAERSRWVERVAALGEAAVAPLVGLLASEDPRPRRNARAALERLAEQWGLEDARTIEMARQLAQAFPTLTVVGQEETISMVSGWYATNATASSELARASGQLLSGAIGSEVTINARALELCALLLARPEHEDVLAQARELVRASLQAESPNIREHAIKLAMHDGLDLLEQVVPLLQDPVAEVRRAAMLAAGPADHIVRDESLLSCLHDPDAEVRRLCEAALQSRGLRPEHVQLARLLTHALPGVRLQVLDHLRRSSDLDPALWLRRLSHDPSPAVRAGAVRMMSQLAQVDLADRLDQIARDDPSPTVAELARFYLKDQLASPLSGER